LKAVAEHFPTFVRFRTRLSPTFVRFRTRLSAVNYRRIARRCLVSLTVVAVVGASVFGAVWNYQRCMGTAEAERGIAAGVLRLKTYGLPPPWHATYAGLMKQRLGVELRGVAGCNVDDGLRRRVEGYNRRMEAEIARRFGPAAHTTILSESRRSK
jgi:hypothetical protein